MITFGPVPSRRLGRSLGINNIPPKICTYSCVYCQAGRTTKMQIERAEFYRPEQIIEAVGTRLEILRAGGEKVDYLTFVPDGEPTLDVNLGREIEALRRFGLKIAVITNSSLLWREEVRTGLSAADWVSVKVDAVHEDAWRKVNRPHGRLKLDQILDGILEFSKAYSGELTTETMLVQGLNDREDQVRETAGYLRSLQPSGAYLSIPIRPPAADHVRCPDEAVINRSYQIFSEALDNVEVLIGYEGNAFSRTGDPEEDILGITAVHPMREDAVRDLLKRSHAGWEVIEKLLAEGKLKKTEYTGRVFYLRSLKPEF
jgi:wyosine [tRNA(Phe)-imidazoG37] synthetase (radical SAM superfamily)